MRKIKWILSMALMLLLCGCGEENHEKKVITLDIGEPQPWMQEAIDKFNAGNESYFVEVPDTEDISDYISVRAVKLTAGEGPDIFAAGADTHFQEFVEKGVLEDLKPYIERDLEEANYLANLLYAYERGGKVYAVETEFQIHGFLGSKDLLGGMENWTPLEAMALMEAHPEIGRFRNAGPEEVLRDFWLFGGIEITDYDMLRECILFAEEYGNLLENGEEAVLGGNVLVEPAMLNYPLALASYEALYGMELCFVGYPRMDGSGFLTGNGGVSVRFGTEALFFGEKGYFGTGALCVSCAAHLRYLYFGAG